MKPVLLAIAIFACALPASANEVSSDTPSVQMTKAERKLVPIVKDYVRNHRGWMDGIYSVECTGHEGDLVVFTVVVTGSDAHHWVLGNGQTFQVLVDPASKTVTRERFF